MGAPLRAVLLACTVERPSTVLIVSLDTTRADALSCYAGQRGATSPHPATPVLDGLAAEGVRFAWALAQAPTTLSSHTSVFSGLDSHGHRVVRNGYPVLPDTPLLAERFRASGWDTRAVVASVALEQAMGLDRGFSRYLDTLETLDAAEVTRRALALVDERELVGGGDPLFLFVHYYDPHTSWDSAPPDLGARFTDPAYAGVVDGSMVSVRAIAALQQMGRLPPADARQARGLYLAQVAWVDAQVGELLAGLRARGLLDRARVVVLADHGESLDEPTGEPYSHGPNAGLADLHVPLLAWGTGSGAPPRGVVVERQVRLVDVATTVAALAGVGGPVGRGEDLAPLWRGGGGDAPPAFAEATQPASREYTGGWNNLAFERAVFTGGLFLRARASGLSVHRLAAGAPTAAVGEAEVVRLARLLQAWDAAAPAFRPAEYDRATEEALRGLGYLEGD